MGVEHFLERVAVDLDDLGLDRGLDRRGAIATGDQRHFPDIGTGRQIGQEHGLAADLFLDHHRSDPDDVYVIALAAFFNNRFASPDIDDLAGFDDFGNIFLGQTRTEHLQQLPLGRNLGDPPFCCGHGRLQFQRRCPRNFHNDDILCRLDRRTAPPSGNQTDFAEDRALLDRHGDRWIVRVDLYRDRTLGYGKQGTSWIVFLEDHLAPAIASRLAIKHEFPHLQG